MAVKAIGGYMGKILRVDLSRERISEEVPDEATLRKYIGGTGLGVKYLYAEVPPVVAWNDPENRIMFMAGPFSGTRVGGSGIFSVVSKGPKTGLAGTTQANGYFAAFLKFSGFDGIIVQGKAKKWLYLHIHDGQAELKDAAFLQGKDTWETEDAIKQEKDKQCSVFSIGPAGERLLPLANIINDGFLSVGGAGIGAVMGSKNLKAIAVKGNHSLAVADGNRFMQVVTALINKLNSAPMTSQSMSSWGSAFFVGLCYQKGILPWNNFQTGSTTP